MASLFGKRVGGTDKGDELPHDYAGALPAAAAAAAGHSGGATTGTPHMEKVDVALTEEASGYKTVVEGTGAGYGDLKESVQGEIGPTEKHVVEENIGAASAGGMFGGSHGSFGSCQDVGAGGAEVVEGKHLHDTKEGKHHAGPMQKIKHKVKEGLAKVRHKKDNAGGDSASSTSSDDEGGLATDKRYTGLGP